jgi:hypothetical protein
MRWHPSLFRKERPVSSADNPDDLSSTPPPLDQERPHCHHDTFAHMALRQVAFTQPLGCLSMLASPDASQFLTDIWKQVDEHCQGRGETSTINPAEFVIHKFCIDSYPCAVLEMPEPWFVSGAHFIALVLMVPLDKIDPADRDAPLCYYTLERGASIEGAPRTVLRSWTKEGTHCNFGDGPPPSLEAFVEVLEERVKSGGQGPLGTYTPGEPK